MSGTVELFNGGEPDSPAVGLVVVLLLSVSEPFFGEADEESEPPVACEPPPPVCVTEFEPGPAVVGAADAPDDEPAGAPEDEPDGAAEDAGGAEVAVADVDAGASAVVLGAAVISGLLPAFKVDGLSRVFQSYEKRTPFNPFSSLSRLRRLYQQKSDAKFASN